VDPTEILNVLPGSVQWMVMFRVAAIRPFADEETMKAMFFLPSRIDLGEVGYVVLTSGGRYLAPLTGKALLLLGDGELSPAVRPEKSLFERHAGLMGAFNPDNADCLGLGEKAPFPSVLLHLEIKDGEGHAKALFRDAPDEKHYELLPSAGIRYESGYASGDFFVACFRNRLPVHLDAASLARYQRTGHCNEFFLRHGKIDRDLEDGLIQASGDRVSAGIRRALAGITNTAGRACREPLAMMCEPPAPEQPFPYGDLVPLGFLLRPLQRSDDHAAIQACQQVSDKLLSARQDGLWAFHTGRLITATDSVLVLQAVEDAEAVSRLERFYDGEAAYYPQLWSTHRVPGRMVMTPANRHWCQPDFPTTCLARALRNRAGLSTVTPLAYLEDWYDDRAGLYFANPYLVDWTLAEAIEKDEGAADLRDNLRRDVLESMNDDFSFGKYDVALSTSLAILTLASLGCRGRVLRLAQLRLLEMMDPDGTWPDCVPFYSTLLAPNGEYELSIYRDAYRMIASGTALLALQQHCSPYLRDLPAAADRLPHPRYQCGTVAEYVRNVAVRPYLEARGSRSPSVWQTTQCAVGL
jgi:hypothetical protein